MNAILAERIVIDPDRVPDGALVRDTGISVDDVLAALIEDPALAAVLRLYPSLDAQDVRAALAYARERMSGTETAPKIERIADLGWTPEQAARIRQQLQPFADDWDDPSMDIYDALPPAR